MKDYIDDISKVPHNHAHLHDGEEGLEDTNENRNRTSPAAQNHMAFNAQFSALSKGEKNVNEKD
ncbi:hypothetical protein KAR91_17340 [Candidatus Pacearchaeota archaeon]|nr:hypothetical protein [Candidatus Pacearchaeota archaeon]